MTDDTKITYAIGDIHGMCAQLKELLHQIHLHHVIAYPELPKKFVFVGDYCDRGPDTKGVVDTLLKLEEDHECVFLRGNHEDMLLEDISNCLFNGGIETFISYGFEYDPKKPLYEHENRHQLSIDFLPKAHRDFFRDTKLWHRDEDRSYCHAGIYRSLGGVENQTERVLLWVRNEFLMDHSVEGGYVVHGHTPTLFTGTREVDIRHNRCNVDTGSVFGGRISAAVFEVGKEKPVHTIWVECPKDGPYA